MADKNALLPVNGAERRDINGVRTEITRAGEGRIRRVIYPVGFRWSKDMKPTVRTDRCMHTHVGFIVQGSIEVEYADGCRRKFTAPEAVTIEAGHDGWVAGDEPAVMIEFDFEGATAQKFGVPSSHRH
jgi:hypothetical protein